MTPNCTLTLGIMNVQSLGWKGKQVPNWTKDIIKKVLKCKCLKFPRIVHLCLIQVSYDQKKGHESNWEFDFRP